MESNSETKKALQAEFFKDVNDLSKILREVPEIYSQYNLSIFLKDTIRTKPLTLATKECSTKNKDCLLLIAPELTDEELGPKNGS